MPAAMQRTCANHPQRRAIGVCMITGKAICSECSTRYEGINYSKEGLETLKRRRQAAKRRSRSTRWLARLSLIATSPAMLVGVYFVYWIMLRWLMDLRQWSS